MFATTVDTLISTIVFVPFLGDFFSMAIMVVPLDGAKQVFVPFLGDFFSISSNFRFKVLQSNTVFVPFLGDFFSIWSMV